MRRIGYTTDEYPGADRRPTVSETTTNPLDLVPNDFFNRYFAFFRPGHQEGAVPSRIKELARLKVASLNACDT